MFRQFSSSDVMVLGSAVVCLQTTVLWGYGKTRMELNEASPAQGHLDD